MAAFYPTITPEHMLMLNAVVRSLERDPFFLDHPNCPYSEETKEFFRSKVNTEPNMDLFSESNLEEALDSQIKRLINDLETFSKQLGTADHSEKLQYFKTKTVLIEKLVNMQERILNLKELAEFRSIVIQFMDDVCTRDQITDLMKKLDGTFDPNVNLPQ